MYTTASAQQTYQELQVLSASPERLVLMLFDAAHRFILQAEEAMEARDYERQADTIIKAQRIYVELTCALDEGAGGELVGTLRTAYNHVHELLRLACVHDDRAALAEALAITVRLGEAWKEAYAQCQPQAA